jgi:flagella synthesis protein FlgN
LSPPSSADRAAFVEGLRAERDAFREFCDLLQAERACLLRSDVEALLDITRRKSERVDHLVELGSARIRYLESQGLEPGASDIEQWLAGHADKIPSSGKTPSSGNAPSPGNSASRGAASQVMKLWQELVEVARTAREMNEANGTLITARLTHNQAALAALRSGARTNSLYGPDGQTNILAGQRELGRA